MESYYKTLGLTHGATQAEIKNAFRRLARRYHPDISTEPHAAERFIEVAEAYEYLMTESGNPVLAQPHHHTLRPPMKPK